MSACADRHRSKLFYFGKFPAQLGTLLTNSLGRKLTKLMLWNHTHVMVRMKPLLCNNVTYFVFQLRDYPCNITNSIFFDVPQTFLEHFLRVNVTFNGAANVIHDVITTANQIPYTAKLMFVESTNNKVQQIRR